MTGTEVYEDSIDDLEYVFRKLIDELYRLEKLGYRDTTYFKEILGIFNRSVKFIRLYNREKKLMLNDYIELRDSLRAFKPFYELISYKSFKDRDLSRTSIYK